MGGRTMNLKEQHLELKLKDYRRFVGTLLILASYLYLGSIIYLYVRQSSDGNFLVLMSLGAVLSAGWFLYRSHRLKAKINENERV
ncbi:YrhC family protein [Virgibacillus kekensis]|uniref:YrhC family protein n=1 Tax=Virgibacillus kekensis TaxID=202261 RepID=A0ABV9DJG3_9BACI